MPNLLSVSCLHRDLNLIFCSTRMCMHRFAKGFCLTLSHLPTKGRTRDRIFTSPLMDWSRYSWDWPVMRATALLLGIPRSIKSIIWLSCESKDLRPFALKKATYVQVCMQMRKLRFLRKIAKIVNCAKKTNPQLGLAILAKIAIFAIFRKNR